MSPPTMKRLRGDMSIEKEKFNYAGSPNEDNMGDKEELEGTRSDWAYRENGSEGERGKCNNTPSHPSIVQGEDSG